MTSSVTTAICVEDISKVYRIGSSPVGEYRTLRETIVQTALAPMRAVANLVGGAAGPQSRTEEYWALRSVSFKVEPGQVVGIIGRNGAGKSTLLKILTGITEPTSGRVKLRGRVGSLLEVGTGFHPELTGRENVFLNGAILGMTREEIRRKFDEIVAFAEIDRFLDTPVKRYSSGMYVRLGFSVAAHLNPEILLVDEVLAVGDAAFQKKCLGKMDEVSHTGRTILFVSHNMAAVKSLCTRGVLLDAGQVICEGNIDQVVDAYLMAGTEMATTGIIPDDAQRIGTGTAKCRRVRLGDASGRAVSEIYLGQPLCVTVECEVHEGIDDAVFEVSISAADGTHVVQCTTMDGKQNPLMVPKGRHALTVRIPVTLLPRQYCFDVGIHHLDGTTIDFVQRTLNFIVLKVAQDKADSYRWNRVRGYVRGSADWQFQRAGSSNVYEANEPSYVSRTES
jgi:lipopolysaccharide transport system ATP-binding protein